MTTKDPREDSSAVRQDAGRPSVHEVLAEWKALAEGATDGPWEMGDRQHVAGVVPARYGDGKCTYCDALGEPSWSGKRSINRSRLSAHVHTKREPWWNHGIYAFRDSGSVQVINDTDEYGYMADDDAAFIAAARTAVPALVKAVEAVLAACDNYREADDAGREWGEVPIVQIERAITDALTEEDR